MSLNFGNIFDIQTGYSAGEGYDEGYQDGYHNGYHDGILVADATYVHEQAEASAEWLIVHNLNKYPSVDVVDTANSLVETGVEYIDKSTVKVIASAPFKGTAYLN